MRTANMARLAVVDGERSPLGYSVANILLVVCLLGETT